MAVDGKWRGKYRSRHEAEFIADQESQGTEQLVFVVRVGVFRQVLVSAFPRTSEKQAKAAWAEHERILFDASDESW